MLLNEYDITGKRAAVKRHYEYALFSGPDSTTETEEVFFSPGMKGIEIVEKYVSRIVGKPVEFFLLQSSRFFAAVRPLGEHPLILDISLSKNGNDQYQVTAEITDNHKVLIELTGSMSSANP